MLKKSCFSFYQQARLLNNKFRLPENKLNLSEKNVTVWFTSTAAAAAGVFDEHFVVAAS